MNTTNTNQDVGFLEKVSDTLNPKNIMKRLDLTPNKIVELLIYFGAGILIGYILKKYAKFVIVLILGVLLLLLLQQLGVLTMIIHPEKIQELFGIQSLNIDENSMVNSYWLWVKTHIALVLSLSIGFLVGLRLGS